MQFLVFYSQEQSAMTYVRHIVQYARDHASKNGLQVTVRKVDVDTAFINDLEHRSQRPLVECVSVGNHVNRESNPTNQDIEDLLTP